MGFLGDVGKVFEKAGDITLRTIPGIGDSMAQEDANEENKKLAEANREWMERMSNTAYQRAMDDMKKSGLNPLLAYQQGGASVPTSTAATVNPASMTGLKEAALGAYTGISTAKAATQNANTAQAQAQSSIALQGAQTANTAAQTAKTQAETSKTIDSIKNQKQQRQLMQQQERLKKVEESAREVANKGLSTVEKLTNNVLKSAAKPSVNPRTLKYENPLKPKSMYDDEEFFHKLKQQRKRK